MPDATLSPELAQSIATVLVAPGGVSLVWTVMQHFGHGDLKKEIEKLRDRKECEHTEMWKAINEGKAAQSGMSAKLDSIDKHIVEIKLDLREALNHSKGGHS